MPSIVNTVSNSNGKTVRYFSSIDADIYFGDQYIDEVNSIQWQIQQNAMPIFGYNSYTVDTIATGSRMISGQFAINFTQSNYLGTVLDTLTRISRVSYGVDNKATTSVYKDEDSIRRHTPIWDSGFNIVVGYGGKKSASYEQHLTLECCQITGCVQALDVTGEPIQEVYSFIARDISYSNSTVAQAITEDSLDEQEISYSETVLKLSGGEISASNSKSTVKISYDLATGYTLEECWIRFLDIDGGLKSLQLAEINDGTITMVYNSALSKDAMNYITEMDAKRLYVSLTVYYNHSDSKQTDGTTRDCEDINIALLVK